MSKTTWKSHNFVLKWPNNKTMWCLFYFSGMLINVLILCWCIILKTSSTRARSEEKKSHSLESTNMKAIHMRFFGLSVTLKPWEIWKWICSFGHCDVLGSGLRLMLVVLGRYHLLVFSTWVSNVRTNSWTLTNQGINGLEWIDYESTCTKNTNGAKRKSIKHQ